MYKSLVSHFSIVFFLLSVSAATAQTVQQVLLTINVSDPSAVTITATTGVSSASSTVDDQQGVELLSFFQTQGTLGFLAFTDDKSSSLVAAQTPGKVLNQWTNDDTTSGSAPDLSLFHNVSDGTVTFSLNQLAFTGSATLDLSSLASDLPAAGSSGSIMTGYSNAKGPIIGTWEVVSTPEPSTWALIFVGALVVAALRLKSRSQRS